MHLKYEKVQPFSEYYDAPRPEGWREPLIIIPMLDFQENESLIAYLQTEYPHFHLINSGHKVYNDIRQELIEQGETVIMATAKWGNLSRERVKTIVNTYLGSRKHYRPAIDIYSSGGCGVVMLFSTQEECLLWEAEEFMFGVDCYWREEDFLNWLDLHDKLNYFSPDA